MGKSSINGPFSMATLNNQRVNHFKRFETQILPLDLLPWSTILFFAPFMTLSFLGKSEYFRKLNSSAIKGDDSPYIHHHLWVSVAT